MRIVLSVIFLSLLCSISYTQEFQRQYKLQNFEESVNIAGLQTSDMGFASLNGISLDTSYRNVFISKYDKKGTLSWSRQLFFNDGDSIEVEVADGSLLQGQDDNLYFSIVVRKLDGGNKVIGALSGSGEYLWSKVIDDGLFQDQSASGANLLGYYYDRGLLHASVVGDDNDPINVVNYLDAEGNVIFMREFIATVEQDTTIVSIGDVSSKADSTILITGGLNTNNSYFFSAHDSLQNSLLSGYFRDTMNMDIEYFGHTVRATIDTGYIVAGKMTIPVINDTIFSSFIAKHDSLGNVVWAKRVGLGNNETSIINGVVIDGDNSIVVGISAELVNPDSTVNIITKLNASGETIWNKLYDKSGVVLNDFGSLTKAVDGGYVLFNTGVIDTLPRTNLIKTNSEGETTCENVFDQDIFINIDVQGKMMTGELIENENLSYVDYGMRADDFNFFAVPTLTIEPPIVCPNLPIDTTLTANVNGETVVSYLWNTGDTTATIRVFDDEMYNVMVTMEGEVCYTLCDTSAVQLYGEPVAQGNYTCNQGTYDLFITYQAQAGLDSIEWSTGDKNVEQINVAEQGNYSVTVTDLCGQTAVFNYNVDPPQPTLTPTFECREDGIYLLSNFDANLILNNQISWSTGSQDDGSLEVLITDKINYTVTVTDICNETSVAPINVNPTPPTVTGTFTCTQNGIDLTAVITGGNEILDIAWSTGNPEDTTQVITVDDLGNYSVTVTDFCRESVSATINVSPQPRDFVPVLQNCNGNEFVYGVSIPQSEYRSIVWNTGNANDTNPTVTITAPGDYTVTIIDICGLESTQSFNVPMLPDQLDITSDFAVACNGNPFTLTASANGDIVNYIWNMTDTTEVFTGFEAGSYQVVAIDECDNQLIQSIIVTEDDLPIDAEDVTISTEVGNICESNSVILTANVIGAYTGVEWSTGETIESIEVPVENQIITVTAFDECGNVTSEQVVNFSKLNALNFPDMFFPGKNDVMNPDNLFFGGYLSNDTMKNAEGIIDTFEATYDDILNFELHVFNRWGQEVFTSDEVTERWDGTDRTVGSNNDEGRESIPEVYVWYAIWEDAEGCEFDAKGDVTLFR